MEATESVSRPLTTEEMQDAFLDHVQACVCNWEAESLQKSVRERLEGLAFSILVLLDGEAVMYPGCQVIPTPHPDDEQFHRQKGSNWYPSGVDIAGSLHERYCQKSSEQEGS